MFKDRWLQKFRKEEDGWKEYSRNGTFDLARLNSLFPISFRLWLE
jgi:hypothetical protein